VSKAPTTIVIEAWTPAMMSDIPDITRLIDELGYPTEEGAMAVRLGRLSRMADVVPSALLLARDSATGKVVGLLQLEIPAHIAATAMATEILALVVSSDYRNHRIGQRLVDAVEEWARQHGTSEIVVRTNAIRSDAHRFYERLGFELTKTSRVYTKTL
jgi:GNAT superfamily N-acetyltransferase